MDKDTIIWVIITNSASLPNGFLLKKMNVEADENSQTLKSVMIFLCRPSEIQHCKESILIFHWIGLTLANKDLKKLT